MYHGTQQYLRRGSRKFFQGGPTLSKIDSVRCITVEVHKYEKYLFFSFPVISARLSFANSPDPPSRSAHDYAFDTGDFLEGKVIVSSVLLIVLRVKLIISK